VGLFYALFLKTALYHYTLGFSLKISFLKKIGLFVGTSMVLQLQVQHYCGYWKGFGFVFVPFKNIFALN
jgi:hypothetical protein